MLRQAVTLPWAVEQAGRGLRGCAVAGGPCLERYVLGTALGAQNGGERPVYWRAGYAARKTRTASRACSRSAFASGRSSSPISIALFRGADMTSQL